MTTGTALISGEVYTDNGLLTLNDNAYTWANGITTRTFGRLWVSGSEATSTRWVDRSAVVWRIDGLPGGLVPINPVPSVGAIFRIGDATMQMADPSKPIQQSAAYGAVPIPSNRLMVAGYTRDKVSRSVLPQPTVWTIDRMSGSVSAVRRMNVNAPGGGHGNLVDIAQSPSGAIWACGSAAASAAYAHAACWNVAPTTPVQNTALNSALSTAFETGGNTIYSSVVMRVRTLSTHGGAKIDQRTVAIGAALVGTGPENATWRGWVYDLNDNTLRTDFALVPGAETLVYDAAGIEYIEEGGAATSWGIMVGGASTTTSASAPDALDEGPLNVTTLRGVERRSLLSGTNDAGTSCSIQDDSAQASAEYDQLVALSSDGQYRLAQAGGQLIRLVKSAESSADLQIRTRDGEVQEHWYTNPVDVRHVQAQLTTTKPHAVLRLGRRLGCALVDNDPSWLNGACSDASTASFDIGPITGGLTAGSASATTLPLNDQLVQNGKLHTEKFDTSPVGNAYKLDMNDYAQVAFKDASDSCSITPVWRVSDVLTENAPTDFDGTRWQECSTDGFVNIDQDYRHCSGCNQMAEVATVGNAHGRQLNECIYGRCEGGNVVHESVPNLHKPNTCYIDNGCYEPNEFRNAVSANDPCSRCKPETSQSQWTVGEPFDTAYRCVAHHDSTPYVNESWHFQSNSSRGSTGQADFKMDDYTTNHLCVKQKAESTGPNNETTSMADPRYWEAIPSGLPKPTWPTHMADLWYYGFGNPKSRNNSRFDQSIETRNWLRQYNIRYLGQMNNRREGGADGEPFYFGKEATQLYLAPGETEWLAFYYKDNNDWQDRIGVLAQFDPANLDVEIETSFVCAYNTADGRARLDGFRYCGAEGGDVFGREPGTRASRGDMGVGCGATDTLNLSKRPSGSGTVARRYSSCVGDTAVPEEELPWNWRRIDPTTNEPVQDGFGPNIASWWGGAQQGIYVEGHLDCGTRPQDTRSGRRRSGWAFIRVTRKNTPGKNTETKCTPITVRATWFHHRTEQGYDACW